MAKPKIYLSASTQEGNKSVNPTYGTEEKQMFRLRDKVRNLLKNDFTIEANDNKNSSLSAIVNESNKFHPALHYAFHSNAGVEKARGCEIYYSKYDKGNGKKAAQIFYKLISEITPTADRGVKSDGTLYSGGLYELTNTVSTAVLMEYIFHSNPLDAVFFLNNIDNLAKATALGFYQYFNIKSPTKEDNVIYPKWLREEKIVLGEYNHSDKFNVNQIDIILKRFYEKFIKGIK